MGDEPCSRLDERGFSQIRVKNGEFVGHIGNSRLDRHRADNPFPDLLDR